ncbi:hypothetical protein cyc_05844 [Cyclospora cayetanensis]|uniref:Uncharacterized protein n=1 Tax=Cyclospora cayetanensis TaxID=88456 RepID=A0A1D3D0H1_9EIME|nr:hypothetical protein cyc_05844 [Cyclospora cayetanensis]
MLGMPREWTGVPHMLSYCTFQEARDTNRWGNGFLSLDDFVEDSYCAFVQNVFSYRHLIPSLSLDSKGYDAMQRSSARPLIAGLLGCQYSLQKLSAFSQAIHQFISFFGNSLGERPLLMEADGAATLVEATQAAVQANVNAVAPQLVKGHALASHKAS